MFVIERNPHNTTRSDFIRFLVSECKRKSPSFTSNDYKNVLQFIKTPQGEKAFSQFQQIPPNKLGLHNPQKAERVIYHALDALQQRTETGSAYHG